jgi:hypothetical protein
MENGVTRLAVIWRALAPRRLEAPPAPAQNPNFLRDNGLTLALSAMFLLSLGGMMWSGHLAFNEELEEHGSSAISLLTYLETGDFLSALFENWESEFLQMAVYVVLTAMLFQRGSAESRDPDSPNRENDEVPPPFGNGDRS